MLFVQYMPHVRYVSFCAFRMTECVGVMDDVRSLRMRSTLAQFVWRIEVHPTEGYETIFINSHRQAAMGLRERERCALRGFCFNYARPLNCHLNIRRWRSVGRRALA